MPPPLFPPSTPLTTHLTHLIHTYQSLNPATITTLDAAPSALAFHRHVARNLPFVLRGGARDWAAMKWDMQSLKRAMEGRSVRVAVTETGNADAIVRNPADGNEYFVQPHSRDENFAAFLDYLAAQERSGDTSGHVRYAQTQNDNLRHEYAALFPAVLRSIPWARIALAQEPDAINLWIGNSRSVSALHRDNYENVYVQVVGEKAFVLVPPVEGVCVGERGFRGARWAVEPGEGAEGRERLVIVPDEGEEMVPCATWDPDQPVEEREGMSRLCRPMRVTLKPGDMLYLPALWYHKVSQTCSEEGICCAVNYWYDMDFGGHFYSTSELLRNIALAATEESS